MTKQAQIEQLKANFEEILSLINSCEKRPYVETLNCVNGLCFKALNLGVNDE